MTYGVPTESLHWTGYGIFALIWCLVPMFVMKEPLTPRKRVGLAVWYLGALCAVAGYLVTR